MSYNFGSNSKNRKLDLLEPFICIFLLCGANLMWVSIIHMYILITRNLSECWTTWWYFVGLEISLLYLCHLGHWKLLSGSSFLLWINLFIISDCFVDTTYNLIKKKKTAHTHKKSPNRKLKIWIFGSLTQNFVKLRPRSRGRAIHGGFLASRSASYKIHRSALSFRDESQLSEWHYSFLPGTSKSPQPSLGSHFLWFLSGMFDSCSLNVLLALRYCLSW